MLIQILFSLSIGILAGTFTGLIPGIHINLVGAFLITLSASLFSSISPVYLVVFIASMAITHTFLDFIPSIFLGCPDTDTELSILPGHELLKQGKGYEAVLLSAYGSLAAIGILVIITVPSILFIPIIYDLIKSLIPHILIFFSLFLIFSEKRKFYAFIVFLLSGLLGFCVLNLEIREPLLPLLTGLFGVSMLLISIKTKTIISNQQITKPDVKIIKPLLGALVASPLCSFLPGLGSGQAAIIGNTIAKTDKKGFLVLLGATNTLVMGFSFISLYVISRTRTGAAVAINEIVGNFSLNVFVLILITVILSGIISYYLTIFLTKKISQKIEKINYTLLSITTLVILTIVVFVFSGFLGIIVLIISGITGVYAISLKVRRTNLMGCLLIPTIIFYLTKTI